MRKIGLFLFFAALFAFESFEGQPVREILFSLEYSDPQNPLDEKTLLSRLKTKKDIPFSQTAFDADLKMLSEDYDIVLPQILPKADGLTILIKIWPKPFIRYIHFKGNNKEKTKTLAKELGMEPGSFFYRQQFQKGLSKIREYYIKKGYFETIVEESVKRDPNKNEVCIDIDIKEGRCGKVEGVDFHGFTKQEKKDLLALMYTKTYNFLTNWLTGTGIFSKEALEQDELVIVNYLQNKGYADAKAEIKLLNSRSGKLIIDITAHRGTLYRFGMVSFTGYDKLKKEDIEKVFFLKQGENFSPDRIRETGQTIKDFYGQKGYIDAQVFYETKLSENTPIYNVEYFIQEGTPYKIGIIRVFGNTQTQANVILRESLLVPGEIFDSRKLKATQTRLDNIGYFKNVNVYPIRNSDTLGPTYRDVHIEVEEASTGSASLFAGLSSLEDVFGGLELTERNFSHKGFATIFKQGFSGFRGSGEFFHMKGMLGAKQQTLLVSWMDPYLNDSLWRFGFEGSMTRSRLQSKDYKIDGYGISVFTSYPLSNYWTFGTKYRIRDATIHVKKSAGEEAHEQQKNSGIISAISSYISYDSTDCAYKPHRGIRSMLDAELAGLGGVADFYKLSLLNISYTPLWPKGVLKLHADFRYIEPFGKTNKNEVPLSERFFLGGETTVRGYRPYILGPRFEKVTDPQGGISSTLLSVEINHEIHRLIDFFVFFDAGNISMKHFLFPPHKLNTSAGCGVRLEIMQHMPFVLGFGYPFNPDHKHDKQKFFFSMGGQF